MKYTLFFVGLISLGLLAGCELEEVTDPNNPDLGSVENDANETQLNTMAIGILGGIRNSHDVYVTATGSVARELYLFDADPRNLEDLLGRDQSVLDNNTYYLVAPYNDSYQVIKTANVLLDAVESTTSITVSEAEKRGYEAFAKTMQAHQFLRVLNMLGANGIRIDVADPDNLGDFVPPAQALAHIAGLLDEAATTLSGGNAEFAFDLHGFGTFGTPAGFLEFNRALAARVAAYRENWQEVLNNLEDSFFGLEQPLQLGPQMVFDNGSGDLLNNLYKRPGNSGDMIYAQPGLIADAEAGDQRIASKVERVTPIRSADLTGEFETRLYESPTSPISIIRNEELILLYAEAQIQLGNFAEGIEALNIIRNTYGLADYSGAMTKEALIDEMLEQRRYSLWGEGHRMVDLRRYGRLNADYLPIDRPGDDVFTEFPIPATENIK